MNDTNHRVVVGVDGSPASIKAVRWAANYATLTGAELEAVTSWAAPGAYGAGLGVGYDAVDVDWQAIAEQTQKTALSEALPDHRETFRNTLVTTIVYDHPAAALLAAAEGADLLVVGSRGHGGFAGMLLGSVSAHVTAHAPCPVVVVRQSGDGAGPGRDSAATPARTLTVATSAPVLSATNS